jgi:hypothetical protein
LSDARFSARLPEPRSRYAELLRRLAEAAISVTNHDAGEHEPGYMHEVEVMEKKFRHILSGCRVRFSKEGKR